MRRVFTSALGVTSRTRVSPSPLTFARWARSSPTPPTTATPPPKKRQGSKMLPLEWQPPPSLEQITLERHPCPGCGSHLQIDSIDEEGYIDPDFFEIERQRREHALEVRRQHELADEIFEQQTGKPRDQRPISESELWALEWRPRPPVCLRCVALKTPVEDGQDVRTNIGTLEPQEFSDRLQKLSEKKGLIVFVVDVTDLLASIMYDVRKLVGNNPILLAVNKVDCLPEELSASKLSHRLDGMLRGRLHAAAVVPVAAHDRRSVKALARKIERHRLGRHVFFLGLTNVGKSTLLNAITEIRAGPRADMQPPLLTTANMAGTTMRPISFKLPNGKRVWDTPGLVPCQSALAILGEAQGEKTWLAVTPVSLRRGITIFVSSLVRIDVISVPRGGAVAHIFAPRHLGCQHRKTASITERVLHASCQKRLRPRGYQPLTKETPLMLELSTRRRASRDIVISHVGWIACRGKGDLRVIVRTPADLHVEERAALLDCTTLPSKTKKK